MTSTEETDIARLTRERDEAREERDRANEACRDEAWKARNAEGRATQTAAALEHFADLAREAMHECIGRDMEIAAAKALASFWREIGVDD